MSSVELLLQNRAQGAEVEQWAARLLADIHEDVRVVGGQHGGCVPESNPYDIVADGAIVYEVKSCMLRVERRGVASGSQPGRWKIDTWNHNALDAETKQRAFYLLVVCDEAGPKSAYVVSHARMTRILEQYARQGRFVSLTTSVWCPRLTRIYHRRRRG